MFNAFLHLCQIRDYEAALSIVFQAIDSPVSLPDYVLRGVGPAVAGLFSPPFPWPPSGSPIPGLSAGLAHAPRLTFPPHCNEHAPSPISVKYQIKVRMKFIFPYK